jgi:serine O-acetyltransferase
MFELFKEIRDDFRNVKINDPAIKSNIELFFNYPGLWALFWYRISHRLYKKGFKVLARVLMGIAQIITNIDIHPASKIGKRVFIDHGIGVVVGETAEIGDNVTIYQGVTLGGVSLSQGKRHPTIRDGVVIGSGAKILGNIEIGENSKIGANSVVVKSVPPDTTAVGVPARIISKGMDKSPLSHDKLPDINAQIFKYLLKRIDILEDAIKTNNQDAIYEKDRELEEIYRAYLNSIK